MAKITVEEAKEFALLPEQSILHLKVEEAEVKDVEGNRGPWQKLDLKFKILGVQATGDGSPVAGYEELIAGPIWGSVPLRLTSSPENRLRQWAEAILGVELGIGFELDTDLFVNRECRGITTQYKKRNGYMAHQVDSLLPKGELTYAAQAPAQQAPTSWIGNPQQSQWVAPTAQSNGQPPLPSGSPGDWAYDGDEPPF